MASTRSVNNFYRSLWGAPWQEARVTMDLFGREMSKPNVTDIIDRVSIIGDGGLRIKFWECFCFSFFYKCKEPAKVFDILIIFVSQFLHTPLGVVSCHFVAHHV